MFVSWTVDIGKLLQSRVLTIGVISRSFKSSSFYFRCLYLFFFRSVNNKQLDYSEKSISIPLKAKFFSLQDDALRHCIAWIHNLVEW